MVKGHLINDTEVKGQKATDFWDIARCSHVKVDGRFRDAYGLDHQSVDGSKHL
jgi:hypothetical protein